MVKGEQWVAEVHSRLLGDRTVNKRPKDTSSSPLRYLVQREKP